MARLVGGLVGGWGEGMCVQVCGRMHELVCGLVGWLGLCVWVCVRWWGVWWVV